MCWKLAKINIYLSLRNNYYSKCSTHLSIRGPTSDRERLSAVDYGISRVRRMRCLVSVRDFHEYAWVCMRVYVYICVCVILLLLYNVFFIWMFPRNIRKRIRLNELKRPCWTWKRGYTKIHTARFFTLLVYHNDQ